MAEQFEIVLVAGPVEAAHGPECIAPVEPDGAERIGRSQSFQNGRRKACTKPKIAYAVVATPAPLHDQMHVFFAHALDDPEAETDSVRCVNMRCLQFVFRQHSAGTCQVKYIFGRNVFQRAIPVGMIDIDFTHITPWSRASRMI